MLKLNTQLPGPKGLCLLSIADVILRHFGQKGCKGSYLLTLWTKDANSGLILTTKEDSRFLDDDNSNFVNNS